VIEGMTRTAVTTLLAAAFIMVLGQRPAMALICTLDRVPAATLLVPYFQVDLKNKKGNGVDTLFSVDNASATAILVHTVIWSDLGVPVLNFNIYLTGYDLQTVDMRDVIDGFLPQTASAGQDPTDKISPKGPLSQDINFASCTGTNSGDTIDNPDLPPTNLSPTVVTHLKNALTGNPSTLLSGNCAGFPHRDNIARGYVTMDTVNNCTARFPGDTGYFAPGGTGDVTNQNVLNGEVVYLDGSGSARAGTMVQIEAAPGVGVGGSTPTNPATTTSGRYTFYGRYDAWTADDNREPLVTSFDARFVSHFKPSSCTKKKCKPLLNEQPQLLVWRDSKVNQGPFACGSMPPWEPLGQEGIVAFDDQEQPQTTGTLLPFPLATQMVPIGGTEIPISITSGWIYLDLNTTVAAAGSNPPVDPAAAGAYVTVIDGVPKTAGAEYPASALDSACAADHFVP
jgi:hypothetical protein